MLCFPQLYNYVFTLQELESENTELRNLCGYLDQAYQKSRHVCLEWQSLGCYTAEVLKVEVASYKTQDRATKEQLEKLVKDNRELKEMCIFLDQSQGGSQDKSLTPPEVVSTMFHAGVVGKVNQQQGKVPQYPGLTKRTTLKDSHAIERGVFSEYSKEVALEQMRTRLKRLEAEKMELIKVDMFESIYHFENNKLENLYISPVEVSTFTRLSIVTK